MYGFDLLDGLRVAEIGTFIAVPFAGRLFADLGAEVRRVELPGDDESALLPPEGRVRLDEYLRLGKGVLSLDELGDVDVVIADERALPAAWTPDPELLVAGLRPGTDAPPVADSALLCALAGISWAIGEEGRPPLTMPARTADFLLGSVFAGATMSLVLAGAHGRHEMLGLAALSGFVEQNSTSYRLSKIGWRREGRRAPGCAGIYPYGLHSCQDGQVVMLGRSTRDWEDIAQGIGADEVLARFPDPFAIAREHADEVDALIAPFLARLTKADVQQLAETKGILAAPVSEMQDVAAREHLGSERGYWRELHGVRLPTLPFVTED
jgi:crotonobetainyl-CoA:carnitine CoA-transferase CaiB-like acyl-CoA transferase